MTQVILPYRPQPNDPEDVTQIMANFDSVASVVNGGIKNDNIAPDAAIAASKLGVISGSQIQFTRGTTPPASPLDGDLWQFAADSSAGMYWLFRYNAGSPSTYKWEFIGGGSMVARIETNESLTSVQTWANLTTDGPLITVPRGGDYFVTATVNSLQSAGQSSLTGIAVGDTSPGAYIHQSGSLTQSGSMQRLLTGLALGDIVKLRYYNGAGGTATFGQRALTILPLRVS